MSSIHLTYFEDSVLLEGKLTRNTITKRFEKNAQEIFKRDIQVVDLSQVTKVDTAGLAWLLLLVEKANQRRYTFSLVNLPQELLKLAKLCAVDTFLPTKN